MDKYTVNSDPALSECIGVLRKMYEEKKFVTVRLDTRKPRTLKQNALLHAWCSQIATEEREYGAGGVKCLCKLHIFMPILRGEDEAFNEVCVQVIDPLPYGSKIKAMEILPVTSKMKTKQLAQGLEDMQGHYVGRVTLKFPDDL